MPTRGSREQDALAKKAVADMGMSSNKFEYGTQIVNPVGPYHTSKGQTGAGSDTRGKVTEGVGHPGPAEAHEET